MSHSIEQVTSDPESIFRHDTSSESRGDAETITIEHISESLESRSSVLEKLTHETTVGISDSINLQQTTTESDAIIRETSTSVFFKENDFDAFGNSDVTTHNNLPNFNTFTTTITHNPATSEMEDRENKSEGDIFQLLPTSGIPDQISENAQHVEKKELAPHKTQTEKTTPKKLPDFDDKSIMLNKIEDIVSSEIQPATLRRKHHIPKEFQCRR